MRTPSPITLTSRGSKVKSSHALKNSVVHEPPHRGRNKSRRRASRGAGEAPQPGAGARAHPAYLREPGPHRARAGSRLSAAPTSPAQYRLPAPRSARRDGPLALAGNRTRRLERRPGARGQVAGDPPRRAREAEVRDLGEAELVLAQRQHQVRHPVAGRQLIARRSRAAPLFRRLAVARRRARTSSPPADRRIGPAARPARRPARLRAGPRSSASPVAASSSRSRVADQVAEQSERDPLGISVGTGARGGASLAADRHHLPCPALGLDPRDRPGVREADRRRREGERLDRDQERSGKAEHGHDPGRPRGPAPPVAAQRLRARRPRASEGARLPRVRRPSGRSPSGRASSSDRPRAGAQPPAIGRRSTTSSASSGSSRTTSAVPSA